MITLVNTIVKELIKIENDAQKISEQGQKDKNYIDSLVDLLNDESKKKIDEIFQQELNGIREAYFEKTKNINERVSKKKEMQTASAEKKFKKKEDDLLKKAFDQIIDSVFKNES